MLEESLREWLLVTYKVPSEPTRFRTYVWRQMTALGCLHLQQALWVLPKAARFEEEFRKLGARIAAFGGEISILTTESPDAQWESRVIDGFNATRDKEFAAIVKYEERFEDALRREAQKRKFAFAEIRELQADWGRLDRWMAKVRARDFFGAPGRRKAEDRMAAGARLLDSVTREIRARFDYDTHGVTETTKA